MSDARKMASSAEDWIETLIADMLASPFKDNEVALGSLHSGKTEIQVQLKVTMNKQDFIDE